MKYRTVENIEGVIYKEKASKFIGYAYFVDNELAIKEYINYVKQMHKKASHHCFAYRLGFDDNNFRAFDDGEPSGTAGKPILQQIDSYNVKNVLLIVVRYFGGTKLGTSGLISAYKASANETLMATNIIEVYHYEQIIFQCNYEQLNSVYNILVSPIEIINSNIDNISKFIVNIPSDLLSDTILKLQEIGVEILES